MPALICRVIKLQSSNQAPPTQYFSTEKMLSSFPPVDFLETGFLPQEVREKEGSIFTTFVVAISELLVNSLSTGCCPSLQMTANIN